MIGVNRAWGCAVTGLSDSSRARWERCETLFCSLVWILLVSSLFSSLASAGPWPRQAEKKIKNRPLRWDPPDVDKALKSLASTPACILADVLEQASTRATEMEGNLPNFTADERIQYESIGPLGEQPEFRNGTFEYLVTPTMTPSGTVIQETRTATKGSEPLLADAQNRGVPELALIFLPRLQADYDMRCEGQASWNGDAAWVIHFNQRAGVEGHTFSYADAFGGVYLAKLKGRAWIAADSGEVVHVETALVEPLHEIRVRNAWLSIDYGPVQFHSQNVRFWLPQTVDAYTQFDEQRLVVYHTFANFMVFSVHTKQEIKKPTEPQ
jgi:hypothetical protein